MARTDAFFLPMQRGGRFCLLHEPDSAAGRGAVLFVHAFAEEMNNSRHIAALQSRAFADAGWTVLQIDLFGCGDSAGDFGEASWKRWVDDVREAFAWLRERSGHQPVLWGLRAGCLLCAQAVDGTLARRVVLWQPVLSGKQHLNQFLRLKTAHQVIAQSAQSPTGTAELRAQLARGSNIEVAGYTLAPNLALDMEGAELALPESVTHVAWLEVMGGAEATLAPASRAQVQRLEGLQRRVDARAVRGTAFWQIPGVTECAELIESTLSIVAGWPRAS